MPNRWLILAVLFFTRTAMALHYVLVASVLPLLRADLGLSYTEAGVLIGLFMVPGIFFSLPGGYLGMWLGDKRLTVLGLACISLGGVLFALAGDFYTAAGARVLGGIGASVLNVILYKMASDWFEGREQSTAVSLVAMSWPIGVGSGLAALGWVGQSYGWPVAALCASALSLVALLAVAQGYRNPAGAAAHARQGAVGWRALGLHEVGVASTSGIARMGYSVGQAIFISFASSYLVETGTPVVQAGFLVSIIAWLALGSTPAGGFLADRTGRPLSVISVGCVLSGLFMLAVPHSPWVFLPFVLMGMVQGLPVGLNALPGRALPPASRSVGFGIFFTWTYLGHTVLPPIAGWLVDYTGRAAASLYFAGGLLLATLLAVAAFHALTRPGRGAA